MIMVRWYVVCACTCDNKAFIMFQSFSKKARDDKFWINHKSNFFLDQSVSRYSSTYKPICKVHLEQK